MWKNSFVAICIEENIIYLCIIRPLGNVGIGKEKTQNLLQINSDGSGNRLQKTESRYIVLYSAEILVIQMTEM